MILLLFVCRRRHLVDREQQGQKSVMCMYCTVQKSTNKWRQSNLKPRKVVEGGNDVIETYHSFLDRARATQDLLVSRFTESRLESLEACQMLMLLIWLVMLRGLFQTSPFRLPLLIVSLCDLGYPSTIPVLLNEPISNSCDLSLVDFKA